jgi:cinnamoyl-CoA:phenyllactate CoA-transferase
MNSEMALHGVKVIELSTFIAVPACARYLADNGADVIKIEAKGGDPVRFAGTQEGRPDDPYENTTFDLENANKRAMVLNLKSQEGMKILLQLLDNSDIFVTNWRPQALQKAGLDYETLHGNFHGWYTAASRATARQVRTRTCQASTLPPFLPVVDSWVPSTRRAPCP